MDRRKFLKKSIVASAAFSLEERILLAAQVKDTPKAEVVQSAASLPTGKIGHFTFSRIILGGNLLSGYAHARDLLYPSALIKAYHTQKKIIETLTMAEENGINAVLLSIPTEAEWMAGDKAILETYRKYKNQYGGTIQAIAQCLPKSNDTETCFKQAADVGAVAAYIQGGVADKWVKYKRIELVAKALDAIKQNNLAAGIGAHLLDVVIESEKAGLKPDFYMKTLHDHNYWSAGEKGKTNKFKTPTDGPSMYDNNWCLRPKETIEFMAEVKTPWIAFKTLAAGAIDPTDGFKYAFENGADFICAGMFDFQIAEDVLIARQTLAENLKRKRPWRG